MTHQENKKNAEIMTTGTLLLLRTCIKERTSLT